DIVATSEEAGPAILIARGGKEVFITGHIEYAPDTLDKEYKRDLLKDLPIDIPKNYYPNDDYRQKPVVRWRSHANLLYSNWLNYFVYQETPYDLSNIM
ncbi:MAG: homoserine O-succinyltransferase, partial [Paludibacteraceae bacterium]|nr:homoserine O-succinyltransferase [Paludibacteraceae bacterium]